MPDWGTLLHMPKPPQVITKEIITAIARERLAMKNGETGLTYAVECAMALINKARDGDVPALRELLDRVEGKVAQAVTGADGGDFKIVHEIRPAISRDEWLRLHNK